MGALDGSTFASRPADESGVLDCYDTPQRDSAPGSPQSSKPWLMVHFACCHAYGRLYRNRAQTLYSGCCPRCGARLSARIGPGGTARRMFQAR